MRPRLDRFGRMVPKGETLTDYMRVKCELLPMLAALEMLASAQRMLADISDYTSADQDFEEKLQDATAGWFTLDDLTNGERFKVVQELAQVAHLCARSIAHGLLPDEVEPEAPVEPSPASSLPAGKPPMARTKLTGGRIAV